MAEARREHDWGQTSSLLAATYEVHRDRKRRRRPFSPREFNPLIQPASETLPISVDQLTQLLTQ
jgi:hypothetical protein